MLAINGAGHVDGVPGRCHDAAARCVTTAAVAPSPRSPPCRPIMNACCAAPHDSDAWTMRAIGRGAPRRPRRHARPTRTARGARSVRCARCRRGRPEYVARFEHDHDTLEGLMSHNDAGSQDIADRGLAQRPHPARGVGSLPGRLSDARIRCVGDHRLLRVRLTYALVGGATADCQRLAISVRGRWSPRR